MEATTEKATLNDANALRKDWLKPEMDVLLVNNSGDGPSDEGGLAQDPS